MHQSGITGHRGRGCGRIQALSAIRRATYAAKKTLMNDFLRLKPLLLSLLMLLLVACGRDLGEPGVLRVTTQPGGAEVTINGQHYGTTPAQSGESLEVKLPTGSYSVEAFRRGDGFVEFVGTAQVEHSETRASAPLVMVLERRLTEAGLAREAEEKARVEERRARMTARFTPLDDGTVLEEEAGLMWMRCAIGQEWTGTDCVGEGRQFNWDRAFEIADEAVFAGYDDWRLPTQPELYPMTFCSTGRRAEPTREGLGGGCVGDYEKPTIITSVFPNTPQHSFWTSTPHARLNYSAWGVSFLTGHTGTGGRSDFIYVRLVRDLQQAQSVAE